MPADRADRGDASSEKILGGMRGRAASIATGRHSMTQVTDRLSAYGTAGYQKGFDHGMRSVDGSLGVRLKW
ncbi:MAG: hypothetical protein WDO56_14470 [Gammaproteobacteria bacterium]